MHLEDISEQTGKSKEPVFTTRWNSCHLGIIMNRNAMKIFHSLAKTTQEESLCEGHRVVSIRLILSISRAQSSLLQWARRQNGWAEDCKQCTRYILSGRGHLKWGISSNSSPIGIRWCYSSAYSTDEWPVKDTHISQAKMVKETLLASKGFSLQPQNLNVTIENKWLEWNQYSFGVCF